MPINRENIVCEIQWVTGLCCEISTSIVIKLIIVSIFAIPKGKEVRTLKKNKWSGSSAG